MAGVKEGFSVTFGVILAIISIPILIIILTCGGCAALLGVGSVAVNEAQQRAKGVADRDRIEQPPSVLQIADATAAGTPTEGVRAIPGIQLADVSLNLTNKGFSKTGPTKIGSIYSTTCKQSQVGLEMICVIDGHTPSAVHRISANVLQTAFPEDQTSTVAAEFLSYVASIPFDGADTRANSDWVRDNIENGGQMTVGPVRFEIAANAPRSRILTIGIASETAELNHPHEATPASVETTTTQPVKSETDIKAEEEKAAANALKLATSLRRKNQTAGNERLEEIIAKWPDTEAASEAKKLLGK